jgi:hypothetical protein
MCAFMSLTVLHKSYCCSDVTAVGVLYVARLVSTSSFIDYETKLVV